MAFPLSPRHSLLLGAACAALAAAYLGWFVAATFRRGRVAAASAVGFEAERRARLRDGSSTYRWFEPILVLWCRLGVGGPERREALAQNLLTAAEPLPWKPEEYLAARRIEAVLAGLLGTAFGAYLLESWMLGPPVGLAAAVGYERLMVKQVARRAAARIRGVKRGLPYSVDLMALTMEVGADFQQALEVVVRESPGTPFAEEFGKVLKEIRMGRTRREALEALRRRLPDLDITDLVHAIVRGQELGTPLSLILRNQAKQMLMKRSQWVEKASQEAQVNLVLPGMITMIACLLIAAAPVVISAVYSGID